MKQRNEDYITQRDLVEAIKNRDYNITQQQLYLIFEEHDWRLLEMNWELMQLHIRYLNVTFKVEK